MRAARSACRWLRRGICARPDNSELLSTTIMQFPRGTKKRKQADSLEGERSLYASFSHAANAVSQLYTAAVQQTKRAEEAGARQALVSKVDLAARAAAVPLGVVYYVVQPYDCIEGRPGRGSEQPKPTRGPLRFPSPFCASRRSVWPSLCSRSMAMRRRCPRRC